MHLFERFYIRDETLLGCLSEGFLGLSIDRGASFQPTTPAPVVISSAVALALTVSQALEWTGTGQDGGTRRRDTAGVHFNTALRRRGLSHGGEPQGQ